MSTNFENGTEGDLNRREKTSGKKKQDNVRGQCAGEGGYDFCSGGFDQPCHPESGNLRPEDCLYGYPFSGFFPAGFPYSQFYHSGPPPPNFTPFQCPIPEFTPPQDSTEDLAPPQGLTPDLSPPQSATPQLTPPQGAKPELTPLQCPTPEFTPPQYPTPDVTPPQCPPPRFTPSDFNPAQCHPHDFTPQCSQPEFTPLHFDQPTFPPQCSQPEFTPQCSQPEFTPQCSQPEFTPLHFDQPTFPPPYCYQPEFTLPQNHKPQFSTDQGSQPELTPRQLPQPEFTLPQNPKRQFSPHQGSQPELTPRQRPQPEFTLPQNPKPQFSTDQGSQPELTPRQRPQPEFTLPQNPKPQFSPHQGFQPELTSQRSRPEFYYYQRRQPEFSPRQHPHSEFTLQPEFIPPEGIRPARPQPEFTPLQPKFTQPQHEFISSQCPPPEVDPCQYPPQIIPSHRSHKQKLSEYPYFVYPNPGHPMQWYQLPEFPYACGPGYPNLQFPHSQFTHPTTNQHPEYPSIEKHFVPPRGRGRGGYHRGRGGSDNQKNSSRGRREFQGANAGPNVQGDYSRGREKFQGEHGGPNVQNNSSRGRREFHGAHYEDYNNQKNFSRGREEFQTQSTHGGPDIQSGFSRGRIGFRAEHRGSKNQGNSQRARDGFTLRRKAQERLNCQNIPSRGQEELPEVPEGSAEMTDNRILAIASAMSQLTVQETPAYPTQEPENTSSVNEISSSSAPSNIFLEFIEIARPLKRIKLLYILRNTSPEERILVFSNHKSGVTYLASLLSSQGFSADSITGEKTLSQREEVIKEFIQGRVKVLVATSVADERKDISNVSLIINYDLPNNVEVFKRRIEIIERTGHPGRVISFHEMKERQSAFIYKETFNSTIVIDEGMNN